MVGLFQGRLHSADSQYFSGGLNSAQLGCARWSESADFPKNALRGLIHLATCVFPCASSRQTRCLLVLRCMMPAQTGRVKTKKTKQKQHRFLPPPQPPATGKHARMTRSGSWVPQLHFTVCGRDRSSERPRSDCHRMSRKQSFSAPLFSLSLASLLLFAASSPPPPPATLPLSPLAALLFRPAFSSQGPILLPRHCVR